MAYLEKSMAMQQLFEQIVGKHSRLKVKFFGISEAELLMHDCVNPFSLQGNAVHSSD